MTGKTIDEQIKDYGIVPLTALNSVDDGLKVCELLSKNDLPILEVTFRTSCAEETIQRASDEFPDMLIGAGTVLTPDQAERAKMAGATFAVSPGLNPKVISRAQEVGLPFFPGVCTPSDIELALQMHLKTLKYFPAEAAGGTKMLKAMIAPYKHLGVTFMPTGGINTANMKDYLEIPQVLAIGGSWLASSKLVEAKDWSQIEKEIVGAKKIVAEIRGE